MVVQCPTCQSKFRIADEKVTDRGVRVRCTSCKNVFQVRKPGAGADPSAAPGPGNTLDLSSLGAAAIARSGGAMRPPAAARPGTGPVKPATGPVKPSTGPLKPSTGPIKPPTGPVKPSTGPIKPPTGPVKPSTGPIKPPTGPVKPPTGPVKPATGPVKPATGPVKPATGPVRATTGQGAQGENGAGRRLDVDDLFGMAELTGDAPLSALDADAASIAAKAADSAPPSGANELELEIDVPPAPKAEAALAETPLPPLDPPVPAPRSGGAELPVPPTAKVPLESLGSPAPADSSGAASGLELDDHAPKPHDTGPRPEPARRPITRPQPVKAKEPEIAPARTVASSALTGLLGAALAVIVVIASALSDDRGAGWLGFGPTSDVIATGVVSGFYDTAGGKPVFYVRGRVQNRSSKVRGPVRVTAELVGDGDPEVKAETIAGAEPTPEDVWSLRSAADADKLTRTLQSERVDRKLQPGASLPFFAVIPDPPADLQGRRLQVRVETVEAWTPRAANAAREK